MMRHNGLFQKKSTPPQQMGFWKFTWRGVKDYENPGRRGGVEPKKIFFGDHFQLNVTTNSTALQFYGSTALQPTWIGINTLWW